MLKSNYILSKFDLDNNKWPWPSQSWQIDVVYLCTYRYMYVAVIHRLWRFKYFQERWKEKPDKTSEKPRFFTASWRSANSCCSNFKWNANCRAISIINDIRREKNPDITEIMMARNNGNCLSKGYSRYCEIGPCTRMTIWLYQA